MGVGGRLALFALRSDTPGMNQAQLVVLMADLGNDDVALESEAALAFLAEYLERMRLTLDQTDYEGLLYTGACIWKLRQRKA